MNWLDQALVEQLGLSLLHFLWQGALIGLLYAATLPATRHASAGTRYLVAVVALAALAAAPALTFVVLQAAAVTGSPAPSVSSAEATLLSLPVTGDAEAGSSVMQWVVIAWLAGVLALSARLLVGWHFLRRLRRTADFAGAAALEPRLQTLLQRLGIERSVSIAVSTGIRSPVVIGWLKPLVLLPPAVVIGLPTRQLEMVLAHELAHVRRLDHLVNLGQTVIETVLFYHPVVRWVSRRIRIERENACDDLAVAVTDDRLAYVEMLASLEKLRFTGPRLALAVHDGQMLSRIRRLIERGRPDRQLGLSGPALLVGLLLAAAGSLQLIDEEPAPEPAPEPTAETLATESGYGEIAAGIESGSAKSASPDSAGTDRPSSRPPGGNSRRAVAEANPDPEPPETINEPRAPEARAPQAGRTATEAAGEPPDLPVMKAERLPPVSELIEPRPGRELAMVERPTLAVPELPEPPAQRAPTPSEPALTGGKLLERVEPDYPGRARRNGIDGSVEAEFLVGRDGSVRDIRIVEETPRGASFGKAAREAIAQWRFEPFRQGEEAIDRRVRVEIGFGLAGRDEKQCRDLLGSRIPRCR